MKAKNDIFDTLIKLFSTLEDCQKTKYLKYLVASEQDITWGITINTVGHQYIKKNGSYPPQNHPSRYLFSTDKGRVLEEYQLLYLKQGCGTFFSKNYAPRELTTGSMFLLFPGEWHNYYPQPAVGWEEYWIGFTGVDIDKYIENGFFKRNKPIFNIGLQSEIVDLYERAIRVANEQEAGYQQMLGGIVHHLLGVAYSYNKQANFEDMQVVNKINKAKIIVAENYDKGISPESIAESIGMSYSWFRRIFKQYTGFSPINYIQEIKIRKSMEMLTNTNLQIKEIAYEAGFNNAEYFSTTFKKKTGYTPDRYRNFTQGRHL